MCTFRYPLLHRVRTVEIIQGLPPRHNGRVCDPGPGFQHSLPTPGKSLAFSEHEFGPHGLAARSVSAIRNGRMVRQEV